MMQAKDLRIGNVVYLDHKDFAKGFMYAIKADDLVDFEAKITLYEPIPLTEDILIRAGFKYKPPGIGGQDGWSGYGIWYKDDVAFLGFKNGNVLYYNRNGDVQYEYLHQLQNLYFALTQTELTLKDHE